MKKFLTRLSLFVMFVATIAVALPQNVSAQGADQTVTNLGDVVVRFCNENGQGEPGQMKELFFEAETNKGYDLCMYINNNGPTDVDVKLNFVDGTITADDSQNKACQPEGTKTNFGQHVDYISETITVKAGTTVETHGEITFPEGMSGMSYGCVTMQFVNDEEENVQAENAMFNILSRRGYFIDVLVGGEINLGLDVNAQTDLQFPNKLSSDQLAVFKDDLGNYKARISVSNPGNIAQEVSVAPTISALFSDPLVGKVVTSQAIVNDSIVENTSLVRGNKETEGTYTTKKILPGQTVLFDFELNDAFPLWKGPIDISAELTHKPVFDYVAAEISPELLASQTITFAGSFFIMPWLIIGILIALLLIGVIATGKKKPTEEKKETKKTTKKRSTRKKKEE